MDDLRGIDLNLLTVLDAVLTERNLTKAGEAIGLTQSAVSGAVSKLRTIIGDPLLVRSGRTFELTDRGRELQPAVRAAVAEVDRTFTLRPMFDPATSDRRFHISASDYALSVMTAPLLEVLGEQAPAVTVEFDVLNSIDPVDLLRKDVVITASGRGVPGKHQSLFSDTFVCLVRHDHPLLVDGALSLEALAQAPFVDVVFADNVTAAATDVLTEAGIEPHIGMSVQGFLPVPFLVTGTDMYGFVPERVADQWGAHLGLVAARTPLSHRTLVEVAHWHPSRHDDPALRWLVEVLRTTAERIEFAGETL